MNLEEATKLKNRLSKIMDHAESGTLRVTFYGGPGTGKSTTNALVFGRLKQHGLNVEMSHEYAKDLVWESRGAALGYQPYIIAKQMWRERRLEGQVDAILTDTSTLFSSIYGSEENGVTPAFTEWVLDEYKRANRLDFFLTRDPNREYNPNGRTQKTIEEASEADAEIRLLLDSNEIDYEVVQVDKDGGEYIDYLAWRIENHLAIQGMYDGAVDVKMLPKIKKLSAFDFWLPEKEEENVESSNPNVIRQAFGF